MKNKEKKSKKESNKILENQVQLLLQEVTLHENLLDMFKAHLQGCLTHAGNITQDDLDYCYKLANRTLTHSRKSYANL